RWRRWTAWSRRSAAAGGCTWAHPLTGRSRVRETPGRRIDRSQWNRSIGGHRAGAGAMDAGQAFVLGAQGFGVAAGVGEFPAELGFAQPRFPGPAQGLGGNRLALVMDALAGAAGAHSGHAADADGLQRPALRFGFAAFVQV